MKDINESSCMSNSTSQNNDGGGSGGESQNNSVYCSLVIDIIFQLSYSLEPSSFQDLTFLLSL
uniref:Uncharacterized protein n=1 Tax=Arion vulgaris TaxID=1028688 RepID=A0A0B7AAL8_9EUPU